MQPLRKSLPFIFAVGAFVACVLACRPGFSPDGNRVLFPVFDEELRTTSLYIYDRKTEKTTTLRTLVWPSESNVIYCAASWSPSGAQIGLLSALGKSATNGSIDLIDVESGGQIRSIALNRTGEGMLLYPPVFTKTYLFFGGESLARVNLRDGRIDYENISTNENREAYILNNQNGVHYYAERKQDEGTNQVSTTEFGTIDVDRFVRMPEQTIPTEITGVPDFSPDGKRIALWKKRPSALEIWFQSKLEKTIPLPGKDSVAVGNLVWSKDQKTIFAPVFQESSQTNSEMKTVLALLEIPLDGSPVRQLEIGFLKLKPEEGMTACQMALAPDGKALALGTPFGSWDNASQQTAVYLIDLRSAKRTVKPIAFRGQNAAK